MAASIGCCFEIGLTDDGLDGLDRRAGVVQHGGEAVAENMGRRAVQVDDAVDPLHSAAIDRHGDGVLALAHDELPLSEGRDVFEQVRDDGNVTHAAPGLRSADDWIVLAAGISHVAAHVDDVFLQIDVVPHQAQDLAPAHAGVDEQRQEALILLLLSLCEDN